MVMFVFEASSLVSKTMSSCCRSFVPIMEAFRTRFKDKHSQMFQISSFFLHFGNQVRNKVSIFPCNLSACDLSPSNLTILNLAPKSSAKITPKSRPAPQYLQPL